MSNLFISDIVGTGVYVPPSADIALHSLDQYFCDLLVAVPDLVFERAIAWVKDSARPGGGEGSRTLNCLLTGVLYDSKKCPTEAEVDTLVAATRAALLAASGDGTITSVGVQEYNIVEYAVPPP